MQFITDSGYEFTDYYSSLTEKCENTLKQHDTKQTAKAMQCNANATQCNKSQRLLQVLENVALLSVGILAACC